MYMYVSLHIVSIPGVLHPQFSPAVTKALVTKTSTGDRRNKLTGDICASIQVYS